MDNPDVNNLNELSAKVDKVFTDNFGRTPLKQRLDDILGEAIELSRYTDLPNLEEEAGDLLSSLIQLCNENKWTPGKLVTNTLNKIERRSLQYKSLGRKTKVAIYGGAFDPITIGHIRVAQVLLNSSREFDEVWLMPVYQHMYGKKMADPEHRLAMCSLAAKDGRIKVSDYEVKHQLAGETYNLVKRLLDEQFAKDEYEFSVAIGQDNANTFHKWHNYEHLENMIRFVVIPRLGVPFDPKVNWYLKPPHIYIAPDNDEDLVQISSTDIRGMLKGGGCRFGDDKTVDQYLDADVLKYIYQHKLYGSAS
jgi:nicotinate-nucleotide adenylyltransferase